MGNLKTLTELKFYLFFFLIMQKEWQNKLKDQTYNFKI